MQCLAVKAAHSFKYFTFVMNTIIFLTLHDLAMLFTSAKVNDVFNSQFHVAATEKFVIK